MWRGGKRKKGYPPKQTDLSLDVWLSFLCLASLQMAVIKLQRLDHKIGFFPFGYRFGNELGYPFITESRLFSLVRLFFFHNGTDHLVCQLSLLSDWSERSLCNLTYSVLLSLLFSRFVKGGYVLRSKCCGERKKADWLLHQSAMYPFLYSVFN